MKKRGISSFITALATVLNSMFLCCTPLVAQEKAVEEEVPFFQGTFIGVDLFGIGNKVFGGSTLSTEIDVEANLKNRYFPVVEIGYGKADTTDDGTDIHYKAAAPFFRIGMNYNFLFKKPYLPGYIYGGIRYGFSSFSYDVEAPLMGSTHWPFPGIPFTYEGVKTNVGWVELVGGIKVKIYRNFHMGWSVRYRRRLNIKRVENTEPWYIPGYGKNSMTALGVTYNLIYKLPF